MIPLISYPKHVFSRHGKDSPRCMIAPQLIINPSLHDVNHSEQRRVKSGTAVLPKQKLRLQVGGMPYEFSGVSRLD